MRSGSGNVPFCKTKLAYGIKVAAGMECAHQLLTHWQPRVVAHKIEVWAKVAGGHDQSVPAGGTKALVNVVAAWQGRAIGSRDGQATQSDHHTCKAAQRGHCEGSNSSD